MGTDTTTPDLNAIPNRLLYPVPEARAKLGGISHSFFYKLVTDGTIHLTKIRGRSFVTVAELEAVVARLSSQEIDEEGEGAREDRGESATEQPAAA